MAMTNDRVFLGKGSHTSEHFAAAALGLGCIVRHRASLIERHIESRLAPAQVARPINRRADKPRLLILGIHEHELFGHERAEYVLHRILSVSDGIKPRGS